MKKLLFGIIIIAVAASCNSRNSGPVDASDEAAINLAGHKAEVKNEQADVSVESEEGIISLENLFSDKKAYAGKVITVKGKVVKVNAAIMERNWVHIQDGTEFEGQFDLTFTTEQSFTPESIVTVKGKIVVDKDFGYGYFYDILMEDAVIVQ